MAARSPLWTCDLAALIRSYPFSSSMCWEQQTTTAEPGWPCRAARPKACHFCRLFSNQKLTTTSKPPASFTLSLSVMSVPRLARFVAMTTVLGKRVSCCNRSGSPLSLEMHCTTLNLFRLWKKSISDSARSGFWHNTSVALAGSQSECILCCHCCSLSHNSWGRTFNLLGVNGGITFGIRE